MTYKNLYLSNGNKKLKSNANTAFAIWNLPAQKTCPFSTALCRDLCYAKKAERVYPNCLQCRERNLNASKQADFVGDMIVLINRKISAKKNRNKKIVVRVHESGDFYSREYAEKWLDIARYFEVREKRVVFMAYTKSIVFFDGLTIPANFVIRCSLWDDSPVDYRKRVEGMPIYTALPRDALDKVLQAGTAIECRCDDCGTCGKCWDKSQKNIIVAIH